MAGIYGAGSPPGDIFHPQVGKGRCQAGRVGRRGRWLKRSLHAHRRCPGPHARGTRYACDHDGRRLEECRGGGALRRARRARADHACKDRRRHSGQTEFKCAIHVCVGDGTKKIVSLKRGLRNGGAAQPDESLQAILFSMTPVLKPIDKLRQPLAQRCAWRETIICLQSIDICVSFNHVARRQGR